MLSETMQSLVHRQPFLAHGTLQEDIDLRRQSVWAPDTLYFPGLETPWFPIAKKPWVMGVLDHYKSNSFFDGKVKGIHCYGFLKNEKQVWPVEIQWTFPERVFWGFKDNLNYLYYRWDQTRHENGALHQGRDATHWSFGVWYKHMGDGGYHRKHAILCTDSYWAEYHTDFKYVRTCNAPEIVERLYTIYNSECIQDE